MTEMIPVQYWWESSLDKEGCAEGLFSLLSLENKISASRTSGIIQGSHSPGLEENTGHTPWDAAEKSNARKGLG